MLKRLLLALALVVAVAPVAVAVQPDEMLDDPALEARARDISRNLRCLVCRNESIDDSGAALAKDLRLLVRERLVAGDTDEEAVDYIVARYGEFVLLSPRAEGLNLVIWLAGPALLLVGGFGACIFIRRQRAAPGRVAPPLTDSERTRLAELTRD